MTVLGWVAEGCPDDQMQGNTHKLTARALENRRLVKVARRDGAWHATTTPAGDHYLTAGAYPDGHFPSRREADTTTTPDRTTPDRTTPDRTTPDRTTADPQAASPTSDGPARRTRTVPRDVGQEPVGPVARLMADVLAADGPVTVDRDDVGSDPGMLAQNAIRFGKVPPGRLLVVGGGWSSKTVTLVDAGERDLDTVTVVRVPARLAKAHPVVEAVRANPQLLPVTALVLGRALRILHALATAMEARGHGVKVVHRPGGYERSPYKALVRFAVDGHSLGVRFRQEFDRTAHVPTAAEVKAQERYEWSRPPKWDDTPSDRLVIEIVDGQKYRKSEWKDARSGAKPVDGRLGEVVRELETRARLADLARAAEDVARERRRPDWEAAKADAAVLLVEQRRADTLAAQAERWARTRLLRDYVDALTATVKERGDPDGRAAKWISWCEAHVARTDPLARDVQMPPAPELTAQVLTPFMRGHSPYGPPM